ncbi:DUF6378 domain-containing protein [Testudinibacter sp. P80/BLE/0925]|uniref:DUF6378 domain-containing protein n=1 Tax=Testudinibacter sp. TW-1 TaxID=3417757 RepID=UPI003D35A414
MTNINTTLKHRQQTYGDYADTAKVAQEIKAVIYANAGELNAKQQEALEMIATKMARILTGNPHYEDNWRDIAGYAQLGGDLWTPENIEDLKIGLSG